MLPVPSVPRALCALLPLWSLSCLALPAAVCLPLSLHLHGPLPMRPITRSTAALGASFHPSSWDTSIGHQSFDIHQ